LPLLEDRDDSLAVAPDAFSDKPFPCMLREGEFVSYYIPAGTVIRTVWNRKQKSGMYEIRAVAQEVVGDRFYSPWSSINMDKWKVVPNDQLPIDHPDRFPLPPQP
jgi:hypothetical protein